MVDPGDGIVTTREFESSDDIEDAIKYVYENFRKEYWIISLEIV